jgi:hypothetical protein
MTPLEKAKFNIRMSSGLLTNRKKIKVEIIRKKIDQYNFEKNKLYFSLRKEL